MRTMKFFSLIFLWAALAVAQTPSGMKQKCPLKVDRENPEASHYFPTGTNVPVTAANYVAVDTMHNTFGPASATINPLVYDPYSEVLAVVHRGNARSYALGSGELWWNYSTDFGATWPRSLTSVQNGLTSQILARYPSMTIANGDFTGNVPWGAFSWPELLSSFAFLGYGVTLDMMTSAFAQLNFDPPTYASNIPTFSDDQYIYWATDNQDDASIRLFRTADYSTVDIIDPPTWNSARFGDNGNITMGGVAYNGVLYYGVTGSFTEQIGLDGWEVAYSKSTDHGSTWSDWFVVDWHTIGFPDYEELWDWKKDDAFVSFAGDIQVDQNGFVHILAGITNLVDSLDERGYNAVVEFFEISEGVWDAKVLAEGDDVHDFSFYQTPNDPAGNAQDPAVGQNGPSFMIAANEDRDFLVAQWVIGSPEAGDTLCDLYYQTRALSEANWSTMTNLTETDQMNEDGAHLAPYLSEQIIGNDIITKAYSMFWYEAGNTSYLISSLEPAVVYIAPVEVRVEVIPVELTSFTAASSENSILLEWVTATEINNLGFEIQKKIQEEWLAIGFIEGNGTTTEQSVYTYQDEISSLNFEGKLYYRLKQIDFDGSYEFSDAVEVDFSNIPKKYSLSQNYPNPFNPSTVISYQLPVSSFVTLKVHDMLGKEIATLVNEDQEAGKFDIEFNGANISSGIYFYTIKAGEFTDTKKFVLIK